jgi:hypothetical protein
MTADTNRRELERRSSAVTLSDMELFIFPELIYSLMLANLMSPRIWAWRQDPWFKGMEKMTPYRRIARVKQYIMDHYVFNLDLDTWGITSKEREMARFSTFINRETLARSNALFGYEGDKYYFDLDIRTHFGLDKYEGSVIPYWKTETIEAMDAFRFKEGYTTGAGECVSLSTLYAAAIFLVARIPLDDIFLMATPLHSQNFVDVDDGILTNNRRLVTKTMWFNGTTLSAQARRALEHEQVTLVAHRTGCIHVLYPESTISLDSYARFSKRLRAYLSAPLSRELLGNYLRHNRELQHCFQIRHALHGVNHFIGAERAFPYEDECPYSLTDQTRPKLLEIVDRELFCTCPLPSRIVLNDLEDFVHQNHINIHDSMDVLRLKAKFACDCFDAEKAIESLVRFCHTEPRLPDASTRKFTSPLAPIDLSPDMTRYELIARIESLRDRNEMAAMAFYCYRDLNRTESEPFILAATQRNPVSLVATRDLPEDRLADAVRKLDDASIYDDPGRLAQPDEVWNYRRGDGAEKALLLANLIRGRHPDVKIRVEIAPDRVTLHAPGGPHSFASSKQLRKQEWDIPHSPDT